MHGQKIPCVKAVKGPDYIKLYDDQGRQIGECTGVSDFTPYRVIGGEWELAEPPESLEQGKERRVAESKAALARYLEDHPLYWSDGRCYSVTMEKQSLLTSALARYQIAAAAGQVLELRWNAAGEECTVWEYEALAALALDIAAYVETFVSRQQALEVEIMAAGSREELEAIVIDYKTPEAMDPTEPETPPENMPSVP